MKPTDTSVLRPTKRQQELLAFIDAFIGTNGYSPSYREIMKGLNYNSVSTVAIHVNNLIRRGHLQKRDRSARSLEVVNPSQLAKKVIARQVAESEERWLVDKIELYFRDAEAKPSVVQEDIEQLKVLLAALQVLRLEGAYGAFMPRLSLLATKQRAVEEYAV